LKGITKEDRKVKKTKPVQLSLK